MIPTSYRLALIHAATAALAAPGLASQAGPMTLEAHWPPTLEQYLPEGQAYDASVPRPSDVLGWPVGTWHVRHDQLVQWFDRLDAVSDRFVVERYGKTHEERPLLLAVVTSPANHAKLEELRRAHYEAVTTGAPSYDGPAVVWMGYGVHGNESSASNASLLLGYHLAAATGPEIERFLETTIVLIDPCVNPDGGSRFAHWANMHRGQNLVGSPLHREHDEAWPGGRTNHYWFDLNRDWLLLTHPESRGRVAQFQRWQPVVLTDYHEMGSGSTYFFQPGIPSRRNPLTPARNHELTAEIATYHAAALDAKGSLYFTEERFDDFYYGKGSTYPDVQGAVGILFEQASSRGHMVDNEYGQLTFPFTIENQFTTSLTTLQAVDAMRDALGRYQREFFRDALRDADAASVRGWVFGDGADPARTREMVARLAMHDIEVHRLGADLASGSQGPGAPGFSAGSAYVVPARQRQYQLIRALFETRTAWDDNTFYDVSSWTFPLSFDVPHRAVERGEWNPGLLGERVRESAPAALAPFSDPGAGTPAFVFEWHRANAAAGLARLLKAGVRARVATRPFEGLAPDGPRPFDVGTILVTMGPQDVPRARIVEALAAVHASGVAVTPLLSGLTPSGMDLGSGNFRALEAPRVLIPVGDSVSAYEAGEIWHDLDTRVGLGVATVERARLSAAALEGFTHLVLVNGATSGWGETEVDRVRSWVRDGGVLIATKRSAVWAAEELMGRAPDDGRGAGTAHLHAAEAKEPRASGASAADDAAGEEADERPRYADYEQQVAQERVAGTIFRADLDITHPLGFGFTRDEVPVFRNFEAVLPEGLDPFAAPLRYTDEPLVSGFASEANVARIAGTPAIRAERLGSGTVIAMVDDPVFRGVWYGTRRFLLNAVFFGKAIGRTGPIGARSAEEEADYDHGHAHNR